MLNTKTSIDQFSVRLSCPKEMVSGGSSYDHPNILVDNSGSLRCTKKRRCLFSDQQVSAVSWKVVNLNAFERLDRWSRAGIGDESERLSLEYTFGQSKLFGKAFHVT